MKKQHLLTLICLLFFLIGGIILYQRNQYNLVSSIEIQIVRKQLAFLTKEERENLGFFFQYAILFDQYAYTLVNAKPMSIAGFLQWAEDLPDLFKKNYQRPKSKLFFDSLEKGLQAWNKYNILFPHKNYPMTTYHQSKSSGLKHISIIHPTLCKKVIQENITDFHEVLGSSYSIEEIFFLITHPEHPLFYQVMEHQRLLGILLGFGRGNAYLFEHNLQNQSSSFTTEWPYWPRKWRLPSFLCDPLTQETQLLKKTYTNARQYIRWTYFGRNDLEVTLVLLQKECL